MGTISEGAFSKFNDSANNVPMAVALAVVAAAARVGSADPGASAVYPMKDIKYSTIHIAHVSASYMSTICEESLSYVHKSVL